MAWIKRHKNWATAVIAVALLGLGAWVYQSLAGDPQLARVKELQKQLRPEQARNLDPEQRKELWQQLGEEMKQLSPEQRRVLAKEREQAFAKKMSDFFALSEEEREAYLDQQIDRMERGRERWQARNADGNTEGGTPGGKGPWGKGGWGGGKGGWGGKKGGDSTASESSTAGGDTASSGATEAPSGKGKAIDPQTREHWRKQRLEETTPEQRAMFSEYFRMLNERRKERGLPQFGRGR